MFTLQVRRCGVTYLYDVHFTVAFTLSHVYVMHVRSRHTGCLAYYDASSYMCARGFIKLLWSRPDFYRAACNADAV